MLTMKGREGVYLRLSRYGQPQDDMIMIHISFNGERTQLPEGTSVAELLERSGAGRQQVAVVVNEAIVRPADRSSTLLKENDQVDVLVFAGGG